MAYSASSDIITNLDATPRVVERTKESGGRVYTAVGEFTSTVFDALTAGQTAAIARIPADARLLGVFATGEATGDTGSFDLGLYRATDNDSTNTVIDLDGLAAAADENVARQRTPLGTAALANSPWLPGNKNKTIREVFTVPAGDNYVDVVATIKTVMGTAKAIAFEVDYTI